MERANLNPDPGAATDVRLGAPTPRPEGLPHLARRAWQRVATNHRVVLAGPAGTYVAQAVDLSRGGALLAIEDPALVGEDRQVEHRVAQHFPDGLEVQFVELDITRRAHVARVVLSPGRTLGIGCSFDHELTTREALVLGVAAGETHVAEVRLAHLPFEPIQGSSLTLVLEDQVAGLSGPFALGPVLGAGEYSVDAQFPQDFDGLTANCGDGPFHAAVVIGLERLWEGPATLVICEPVERVGTRVRVLFEDSFDHRLARRLRRREE